MCSQISARAPLQLTMREVQGAIIGSGFLVFLIGATGILRLILKLISPITVAANIGIVGLALYGAGFNSEHLLHLLLDALLSCWCQLLPCMPGARLRRLLLMHTSPQLPRYRRHGLPPAVPHAHLLHHPVQPVHAQHRRPVGLVQVSAAACT
jgi:hypothetical protein